MSQLNSLGDSRPCGAAPGVTRLRLWQISGKLAPTAAALTTLRHTFATWLEDAGIPSRGIDELMGRAGGRRVGGDGGSPMGRVCRKTTPAMLARVTAALDERIVRVMAAAGTPQRDAEGPAGAQAG